MGEYDTAFTIAIDSETLEPLYIDFSKFVKKSMVTDNHLND